MTTDILTLSRRLRAARTAAGLTQGEVATHLDLHREAVSAIESTRRDVKALELARLAELYKIPIADLVAFDALDDVPTGTRPVAAPAGGEST